MANIAQRHGIGRLPGNRFTFTGDLYGNAIPGRGQTYYVDTVNGRAGYAGKSWAEPFLTMAAALAVAATNDTIFFAGDVREELTGSNLVFDLTIIGVGNNPHHPDLPSAGVNPGASCWRPPASPTADTDLLVVRGRGWRFVNIMFDAPVDAAAVKLSRNALSGTSEYDASHASFIGCRFDGGATGIEDDGGCAFVTVDDCAFRGLTDAILNSSSSVAAPLCWKIRDNEFRDNTNHIDAGFSRAAIKANTFGKFTTKGIDLTSGEYNSIWGNSLSGTYSIAGGYTAGSNDEWSGNYNSLSGGVTAADPA